MSASAWVLGGLGVALVAAAASSSSSSSSKPDPNKPGGGGGGGDHRDRLVGALQVLPLTETQRAFLLLTAWGESKFRPTAHNGSASERLAASKMAARSPELVAQWRKCGHSPELLGTGSWGMFQRLAPLLAFDALELFPAGDARRCSNADPTTTSFAFQLASALESARDLQGYKGWQAYPTVGNLRLGWASPGFMGYISKHAARLDKYRRHAREAGLPESIVDAPLTMLPDIARDAYAILGGT